MNMPHATSFGLDWPITPAGHEKKLAASTARDVTSVFIPADAPELGSAWSADLEVDGLSTGKCVP
ncbi:MAG TPA: hypothetical protein PLI79_07725 [Mycobacterium sp.]|nr:hypothetical protein [Mycobacterium sp.]